MAVDNRCLDGVHHRGDDATIRCVRRKPCLNVSWRGHVGHKRRCGAGFIQVIARSTRHGIPVPADAGDTELAVPKESRRRLDIERAR